MCAKKKKRKKGKKGKKKGKKEKKGKKKDVLWSTSREALSRSS